MCKKISITNVLKEMEVGDERRFPADRYRSVCAVSSDFGFVYGRKYKVSKDWENRVVVVTRTV